MRLLEVENRFVNDLVVILRNLRGRSDARKTTAPIPYASVNGMLQGMGYGNINKEILQKLVNSNKELDQEIKSIDDNVIVLNTDVDAMQQSTDTGRGNSVDRMAKSAAGDYQRNLN